MRWVHKLFSYLSFALAIVPMALLQGAVETALPGWCFPAVAFTQVAVIFALEGFFPQKYRWTALPLTLVSAVAQMALLDVPIAGRLLFAVPIFLYSIVALATASVFTTRLMSIQQLAGGAAVYAIVYCLAYLNDARQILPALGIWCSVYLIWCIVLLNISATDDVAGSNGAKSLRLGNLALTILFVAAALALVNIGVLKDALVWVVTGIIRAVFWLLALFERPQGEDGGMGGGSDEPMMPFSDEPSEPSMFATIMQYVVFVVGTLLAVALVGYMLYRTCKIIIVLYKRLREWLSVSEKEKVDYEDEQFSLMTWKQAQSDALDNLKRAVRRITHRPPRWDNLDNRQKLRYVMESTLFRGRKVAPDLSRTAQEHAAVLPPRKGGDAQAFADAYDRARYSKLPVTDEDAANARKFV